MSRIKQKVLEIETNYGCCANKHHGLYICKNCYKTYHRSCLERKIFTKIDHNIIICCSKSSNTLLEDLQAELAEKASEISALKKALSLNSKHNESILEESITMEVSLTKKIEDLELVLKDARECNPKTTSNTEVECQTDLASLKLSSHKSSQTNQVASRVAYTQYVPIETAEKEIQSVTVSTTAFTQTKICTLEETETQTVLNQENDEYGSYIDAYEKINTFKRVTEITQDLFLVDNSYSLAHCVASDLKMSKGIATEFVKRFQNVEELKNQQTVPGEVAYLKNKNRFIFYLVTKINSCDLPTYENLHKSLVKLKNIMLDKQLTKLAIPKIACGLDKLKWIHVKKLIEYVFTNTEIEILVCNKAQNQIRVRYSQNEYNLNKESDLETILDKLNGDNTKVMENGYRMQNVETQTTINEDDIRKKDEKKQLSSCKQYYSRIFLNSVYKKNAQAVNSTQKLNQETNTVNNKRKSPLRKENFHDQRIYKQKWKVPPTK